MSKSKEPKKETVKEETQKTETNAEKLSRLKAEEKQILDDYITGIIKEAEKYGMEIGVFLDRNSVLQVLQYVIANPARMEAVLRPEVRVKQAEERR